MRNDKPLTTGRIAAYCQVSHVTVLKWIKSGKLRAYTIPSGHYRVQEEDFKDFLIAHNMPVDGSFFGETSKRILVVDDEPTVVSLIVDVLQENGRGYELATASDGFEAGLQVAGFKPDLIILDLVLPRADGFEVCQRVKSDPATKHIKVLLVTAYPEAITEERFLTCGADDYLIKPLQVGDLRDKVKTLLEGSV